MNEHPTGGISGVDPLRAIIAATERVILKFLSDREAKAAAPEDHGTSTVNQVAEHLRANPVKQMKTVEELAAIVRQDLSQIEGCPTGRRQGDRLRSQPMELSANIWRADAGPVHNRAELPGLFDVIFRGLKRL